MFQGLPLLLLGVEEGRLGEQGQGAPLPSPAPQPHSETPSQCRGSRVRAEGQRDSEELQHPVVREVTPGVWKKGGSGTEQTSRAEGGQELRRGNLCPRAPSPGVWGLT